MSPLLRQSLQRYRLTARPEGAAQEEGLPEEERGGIAPDSATKSRVLLLRDLRGTQLDFGAIALWSKCNDRGDECLGIGLWSGGSGARLS